MGQTAPVCPRCGVAVASGSATCSACGFALASEDAAQAVAMQAPPGGAAWSEHPGDAGTAGPIPGRAASAGTSQEIGRSDPDQVEGQVRGIMARSDGGEGETVWTFRLERYDELGNRELLVPVEMRGYRFEGSIAEGDWVRLRGSARRGTIRVAELENVTTGATVTANTTPRTVGAIAGAIFAAVFVAVVVFMVVMFIRYR